VEKHADLFRATDSELYARIPAYLKKLLVLDKWYHRDFIMMYEHNFDTTEIKRVFDFNKDLGSLEDVDLEMFTALTKQQEDGTKAGNVEASTNKPSGYETWNMIADVIVNKSSEYYKPTVNSNTHWKYWPESGSL